MIVSIDACRKQIAWPTSSFKDYLLPPPQTGPTLQNIIMLRGKFHHNDTSLIKMIKKKQTNVISFYIKY